MDNVFWTGVGAAAAAVIGALVGGYMKLSGLWHTQRGETQKQKLEEYREVTEQLRKTHEADREEIHELRNTVQELNSRESLCIAERARAEERISSYEDILRRHDIKFRPWRPNDSSPLMDTES